MPLGKSIKMGAVHPGQVSPALRRKLNRTGPIFWPRNGCLEFHVAARAHCVVSTHWVRLGNFCRKLRRFVNLLCVKPREFLKNSSDYRHLPDIYRFAVTTVEATITNRYKLCLIRPDLDTVIFPVGNVQPAGIIQGNVAGIIKLSVARSPAAKDE